MDHGAILVKSQDGFGRTLPALVFGEDVIVFDTQNKIVEFRKLDDLIYKELDNDSDFAELYENEVAKK